MKAKLLPSQEELLSTFAYDEVTGVLRWKIAPSYRVKAGAVAGTLVSSGNICFIWRYKEWTASRVVWKMMTGEDAILVEHVNGDLTDNRFCNLRSITRNAMGEKQKEVIFPKHMVHKGKSNFIVIKGLRAKNTKELPSVEALNYLFFYNTESGDLFFRFGTRNKKRLAGECVRTKCKGYYKTSIEGKEYYAHRIAWKIMTGEDPHTIDHIDGNGFNNAWHNLRDGTISQNLGNMKTSIRNKSGEKGVYWAKDKQKWTAQISIDGKPRYIGRFSTLEEAKAAYDKEALVRFGFVSERGRKIA